MQRHLWQDDEITGLRVLFVAHCIQGNIRPGDCDVGHWRDVLLLYISVFILATLIFAVLHFLFFVLSLWFGS